MYLFFFFVVFGDILIVFGVLNFVLLYFCLLFCLFLCVFELFLFL